MKKNKILLVVGARPNFMKLAPIYFELKKYKQFQPIIVHTGQHYDKEMSDLFFRDLGLPKPHIYLGVGSASHSVQTAKIMVEFEKILIQQDPDVVIVVGDVNSTIACSLATAKYRCIRSRKHIRISEDQRVEYQNIRVSGKQKKPNKPEKLNRLKRPIIAHVEAGLRSFDRTMPEEINRLLTDQISDMLFTTCQDADRNLIKEGIDRKKIFFVGNVMIDSLKNSIQRIEKIKMQRITERPYALVTLHRPSNVDNKRVFTGIMQALSSIAKQIPVIFPVHPRTRKMFTKKILKPHTYFVLRGRQVQDDTKEIASDSVLAMTGGGRFALKAINEGKIFLTQPLGYLEFLDLMANAALVLTDSGGIQEETTILGVPCLTIRENTERPITITQGTNKLVGTDPEKIVKEAMTIIANLEFRNADLRRRRSKKKYQCNLPLNQCYRRSRRRRRPALWDGKAAERIVARIAAIVARRKRR